MAQSMEMINTLDDCYVRTADIIIKEYVDEEERKMTLEELRNILQESCFQSARIMAANEIKERMELTFDPEAKNVEDIIKEYEQAIYNIQVDSSKYNRLSKYDRQIEALFQANKTASSQELDDTNADLQVMGSDINVIDPISKTRMTNPVKNAVCGHVYDKESLIAMLQKNKHTRCPVVGCSSVDYINLNNCRTDIVTKTYLERNPV